MTNIDGSSETARWRRVVRLAVYATFLAGLFYLVAVTRIIDVEDVRRTVAATGPVAPLTYVAVSALLGAIFVPGPILAAGSGVLFGPVLGTSSGSVSSQASPTRWPHMRSVRSEFRCGRWPRVRSSDLRRAHSSTPRLARRSEICRHRWHTPRSPCGA
jgi:hypothetical protein